MSPKRYTTVLVKKWAGKGPKPFKIGVDKDHDLYSSDGEQTKIRNIIENQESLPTIQYPTMGMLRKASCSGARRRDLER